MSITTTAQSTQSTGRVGERLAAVAAELRSVLRVVDAACVTGNEAVAMVDAFAAVGHLAGAGKMVFARRVEETGAYKAEGFTIAEQWLAAHSATTLGPAMKALETARHLEKLSATREAVLGGELSETQAHEITSAAAKAPEMEQSLLDAAGRETVKSLRDRCRQIRMSSSSPEEDKARRDRQHRGRYFRSSTSENGSVHGEFDLTPDLGVRVVAAIRQRADALFAQARAEGRREPSETYMADALVALVLCGMFTGAAPAPTPQADAPPADADVDGDLWGDGEAAANRDGGGDDGDRGEDGDRGDDNPGPAAAAPAEPAPPPPAPVHAPAPGRAPGVKIIVRIDHSALLRDHTVAGETCEIVGVGPVPVAVVQEMMGDAFLAAVVTKGVDVVNVAHLGRRATVHQYTAMQWRSPECDVLGCNRTARLEVDHRTGWAITRDTRLLDLDHLCDPHHDLKTYEGWRLEPGRGKRRFLPPESVDASSSGPGPPPP